MVKIHIPLLTVAGVKTPRALLNSAIDGRKVVIESPRIELFLRVRARIRCGRYLIKKYTGKYWAT
ncbi:hypothetical protein [Paraflavitalea speifideaquila]|uniref:hypothetical protein n=1 Tax=Paraflavitalea speifideaquila TaxID=3076558 RepID=UPI0028E56877|nr:hypothetical protein [Paraflavitalea speifideiaquila]